MSNVSRRAFIKAFGLAAVAGTGLFGASAQAQRRAAAHVVILGGGIGGSTAAKYTRIMNPDVRITLIEQNAAYITCPRSNEVITGHFTLDDLTFDYETIKSRFDVDVIIDRVVGVDPDRREVRTQGGERVSYDRLVVSPGIDFRYEEIEGYTAEVAETRMPHAWKAGPQTLLLKRQLEALPQGGTVLIAPPQNPFRCPPGPYERSSLITEWLAQHNPRAKVLILDPKDRFTKDVPFKKGWERLYGYGTEHSRIEWISGSQGGRVLSVDPERMTVEAENGMHRADLVNIIPPQKAGKLAFDIGLVDQTGWCPVDRATFKSTQLDDIHVIGDSAVCDAMPKSGYSANSHAKLVAHVIRAELSGFDPVVPTWANTCYSLVGSDYGVSISDVFELRDGLIQKVPDSGAVSPVTDNPAQPLLESVYLKNWHRTFVKDVFS
ncbi:MAG TPA: flavocytochrome c sulfide dehydrogenase flavin-binding protein [Thioalkalivibrio sp.]|nr:flavocytochrome c sulfide dehydrogenase flavin-binding protein [Thioalkalivibrio sp.]